MLASRDPIRPFLENFPANDFVSSILLLFFLPFVFVFWLVTLALELLLQLIFSIMKLFFQTIRSFLQVSREGKISVTETSVVSPNEETYMQEKIDDLHHSFRALETLFRLKKEGALTQEEFEVKKAKLLKEM